VLKLLHNLTEKLISKAKKENLSSGEEVIFILINALFLA